MNKYQLIIFDLDGTLIDSKKDIVCACNHTLNQLGFDSLSEDLIHSFVGMGLNEFAIDALQAAGASPDLLDDAIHSFKNYYLKNGTKHTVWYPGVAEGLKILSKNAKLAVLTNKPIALTTTLLEQLGFAGFFWEVIGSEGKWPHKPDPEAANYLIKKAQLNSQSVIFVGDSIVDAKTAENAGIDCVLMNYGFTEKEEIKKLKAKKYFDHFNDLVNWINEPSKN